MNEFQGAYMMAALAQSDWLEIRARAIEHFKTRFPQYRDVGLSLHGDRIEIDTDSPWRQLKDLVCCLNDLTMKLRLCLGITSIAMRKHAGPFISYYEYKITYKGLEMVANTLDKQSAKKKPNATGNVSPEDVTQYSLMPIVPLVNCQDIARQFQLDLKSLIAYVNSLPVQSFKNLSSGETLVSTSSIETIVNGFLQATAAVSNETNGNGKEPVAEPAAETQPRPSGFRIPKDMSPGKTGGATLKAALTFQGKRQEECLRAIVNGDPLGTSLVQRLSQLHSDREEAKKQIIAAAKRNWNRLQKQDGSELEDEEKED